MPRHNLLKVGYKVNRQSAVLYLTGELIAETRIEPERILRDWLENGVLFVCVCCDGLKHIDSAGMSTLLAASHRYHHAGGEVAIAELEDNINCILSDSLLKRYFKLYPTLRQALEYLKGPEDELDRRKKAEQDVKADLAADRDNKSGKKAMPMKAVRSKTTRKKTTPRNTAGKKTTRKKTTPRKIAGKKTTRKKTTTRKIMRPKKRPFRASKRRNKSGGR